jgi:hypothetical protein
MSRVSQESLCKVLESAVAWVKREAESSSQLREIALAVIALTDAGEDPLSH